MTDRLAISYADWSAREYASIAASLLSLRVASGGNVAALAAQVQALLGQLGQLGQLSQHAHSTVYPVNYAHTGLELALAVFQRHAGQRRKVLVPAYVCPIVVHSIQACGLEPVPLAIGSDLNMLPQSLSERLDADTLAVVAPHMFGCPARIAEIEAQCRAAGVFLIDDAAQVFGVTQDGRPLGSFGDVGLVSFAQSKTIVTGIRGAGGLLLVNNPALDAELGQAWRALPAPRGRLAALAEFLWNYQWQAATGDSGERLLDWLARRGRTRAGAAPRQQARISHLEAGLARAQLQRLPAILAARTRVAELYGEAFAGSTVQFPQYARGRYLARVMLALPEGCELAASRRVLAAAGIQSRLGYQVPFDDRTDHPRAVTKARILATRLLGVPCGPDIGAAQVRAVRQQLALAVGRAASLPT